MLKINVGVIGAGIIWLLMLAGCVKDKSDTSTCTTCSATSFKTDIIPIFNQYCATAGCHHGSYASNGHLNLDSAVAYAQITQAGTGYVIDSNANNSIFYDQIVSPVNASGHMPTGSQLPPCLTQKIYCWIQQGARNN